MECVKGAVQSGNCYDNYYPGVPTWHVSGLPTGVNWTYNPNPAISTTCSATFTQAAPAGTYNLSECAVFPPSPQYPGGVSDCFAQYTLKIEVSLYLDVVVDGFVNGPPGSTSVSQTSAAAVDKCVLTYYCCYAKLNAGPQSKDPSDPKSPVQTYIAANCYGGDTLATNSITYNAYQYNTPKGSPQSKTINAGTCSPLSNLVGGFYCETPHTAAILVTGRSEISRPSAKVIDAAGDLDLSELNGELDLNDKIVNYPQVNASGSGYGPGVVPFPSGPFYNCYGASAKYPPCTKANAITFKNTLLAFYKASGRTVPAGVTVSPATYDTHHIQPSAWGGTDSELNGVFLTNKLTSANDHQRFSTWWCSFSLPSAPAPPNCATIE